MSENELKVLGRYTILGELGRGGFATVYRAVDPDLDREVALKVMHPMLLSDPSFTQRFRREARALAVMRHPNVIVVHEVSQAEGRLFIVMELANGPSLDKRIAAQGPIAWRDVISIMKPVCEALDYAHNQKIVHRDLKPANILLDKDRGPLLTDFGMARLMGGSSASLSLSGGILGTPAYIAPEIWEMEEAGVPVDIYALGCIVYEMLTGQTLFTGQSPMQIMRAHDKGPQLPVQWAEDTPLGVSEVLNKALARHPQDRYASAMDFWQALNDLDVEAQSAREQEQKQALIEPWRKEVEAAMTAGEWSAARMAVGRWLAIAPDDAAALSAKAVIERNEARVAKQREEAKQAPPVAQKKDIQTGKGVAGEQPPVRQNTGKAASAQPPVNSGGTRTAPIQPAVNQATGKPASGQLEKAETKETVVEPGPGQPGKQEKKKRKTLFWIGGIALAAVICVVALGALLISFLNSYTPSAPVASVEATPTGLAAANTPTPLPAGVKTVAPTKPPIKVTPTATKWATKAAEIAPTATPAPAWVGDPIQFLREYYDLLALHRCDQAFSEQTADFQRSMGTYNNFKAYEDWCQTIDKIEFIRHETLEVTSDTAWVVITIQYTYTSGKTAMDRPVVFGLIADPSGQRWLINETHYQ